MTLTRDLGLPLPSFVALALAGSTAAYGILSLTPWLLAPAAALACLSAFMLVRTRRVRLAGALLLCLGATASVTSIAVLIPRVYPFLRSTASIPELFITMSARYLPKSRAAADQDLALDGHEYQPRPPGICGTSLFGAPRTNLVRRDTHRGRFVTSVRIGNTHATKGLDKNVIRRHVSRELPRIRYCYERRLQARYMSPGTVVASFAISPEGSVVTSAASGVNEEVSSCVAEVIASIEFPRPEAGQTVRADYPFELRAHAQSTAMSPTLDQAMTFRSCPEPERRGSVHRRGSMGWDVSEFSGMSVGGGVVMGAAVPACNSGTGAWPSLISYDDGTDLNPSP